MSAPHSTRDRLRACVTRDLVDTLKTLFPDRLPDKLPTPEEMGRLIGQQEVVRAIAAAFEEAERRNARANSHV